MALSRACINVNSIKLSLRQLPQLSSTASMLHSTTTFVPTDKSAILSSTYDVQTAGGNAVDGVYIPNLPLVEDHNMAHSEMETNPWWRVDLQGIYCIIAVNILNRICKYPAYITY